MKAIKAIALLALLCWSPSRAQTGYGTTPTPRFDPTQPLTAESPQALSRKFTSPEGFSIKLPNGWERLDRQVRDDYVQSLKERLPASRVPEVVDGFALEGNMASIGYPRIMVTVNRAGRITEEQLKKWTSSGRSLRESISQKARTEFDRNALAASMGIDDVSYDEHGHFCRIESRMSVSDSEMTHMIQISFPTRSGILSFQFISLDRDYEQYRSLFSEVIQGIEVYNLTKAGAVAPRAVGTGKMDHFWYEPYVENGMKYIGAAMIVFIASYLRRRNRAKHAKPIEEEAYDMLQEATQLEVQGMAADAIKKYREVGDKYRGTAAASDAERSIAALMGKLAG